MDRAAFERRIAAAIQRGRARVGQSITEQEAQERARQVAAQLPGLFSSPQKHAT